MVEQWSSKPYAWVRFLLSLIILYSKPLQSKQKSYFAKSLQVVKNINPKIMTRSIPHTKLTKPKLFKVFLQNTKNATSKNKTTYLRLYKPLNLKTYFLYNYVSTQRLKHKLRFKHTAFNYKPILNSNRSTNNKHLQNRT